METYFVPAVDSYTVEPVDTQKKLKPGNNKIMKLLTKELEQRFKEVGSQEKEKDPIIVAKFFDPTGPATWFATEYEPAEKMFFGYVTLYGLGSPEDEFGMFGLEELEKLQCRFGLGVERDLHFGEKKLSEVKK
jgi:hypothetical protein